MKEFINPTNFHTWLADQIANKSLSSTEINNYLINNGFEHPHGGVDWPKWEEFNRHRNSLLTPSDKASSTTLDHSTSKKDARITLDLRSRRLKNLYKLKTNGFFIEDAINKLPIEQKLSTLKHIASLHIQLEGDLIEELIDIDGNDLMTLINSKGCSSELANDLSEIEFSSFFVAPNELCFDNIELAQHASIQFRKIFIMLGIIIESEMGCFLNLGTLDSIQFQKNINTCEYEETIANYLSLFPKK